MEVDDMVVVIMSEGGCDNGDAELPLRQSRQAALAMMLGAEIYPGVTRGPTNLTRRGGWGTDTVDLQFINIFLLSLHPISVSPILVLL